MERGEAIERLWSAVLVHGGEGFSTHHETDRLTRPLFDWAWDWMWLRDAAHVAASLVLDGADVRELP